MFGGGLETQPKFIWKGGVEVPRMERSVVCSVNGEKDAFGKMPRLVIPKYFGRPSIGLALFGCTNRPFYHVCVFPDRALGRRYESNIIEQVGTFDPLPNKNNEKLVALNYGRLKYWIGERDAHISVPVLELLGIAGLFPIYPKTFIRSKDNRNLLSQRQEAAVTETAPVQEEAAVHGSCHENVKIHYNTSGLNVSAADFHYELIDNSAVCLQYLNDNQASDDDVELCPLGYIQTEITPIVFTPSSSNIEPYVYLNISSLIFASAEAVVLRLHCLHSPNSDDTYCHNAGRMVVDGVWRWPCRGVRLRHNEHLQIPFSFGFNCFRMFGLSQYMLNVTLYPHNCRASYLVTSPEDRKLSTKIHEVFTNEKDELAEWAPMVVVDLSIDDGVFIRVAAPKRQFSQKISVVVLEKHDDGLAPVRNFDIVAPATSVKWMNAAAGEYMIFAYVPRHDCMLPCENTTHPNCRLCVHTWMNVTLDEDKSSISWKGLRAARNALPIIAISLFVACAFGCLATLLYVLLLRRRAAAASGPRDVRLRERVKLLIIYSDDCDEHTETVHVLANVLNEVSFCDVIIDHAELLLTGVRPSRWLVDSMCRAEKVLIVISPCSPFLIQGRSLIDRKPYPDQFLPGLEMAIRECTTRMSHTRFCVIRFSYSPPTPPQIQMLGIRCFQLPSELGLLTAHLHGMEVDRVLTSEADAHAMERLQRVVEKVEQKIAEQPHCIEERFHNLETPVTEVETLDMVEREDLIDRTDEQRRAEAEHFGLLPPSDDSDNDGESSCEDVGLLPPDSDDDHETKF